MKYYRHNFYARKANSFKVIKPIEIVCDEKVIAYTDDAGWLDYLIKGEICESDEKEDCAKAKGLLQKAMHILKEYRENDNSPVII